MWGVSMWNSGGVNLGLNEAFSLWLSVLLVMLLSSLMMVMLFVLVSLKIELVSIRWQLN